MCLIGLRTGKFRGINSLSCLNTLKKLPSVDFFFRRCPYKAKIRASPLISSRILFKIQERGQKLLPFALLFTLKCPPHRQLVKSKNFNFVVRIQTTYQFLNFGSNIRSKSPRSETYFQKCARINTTRKLIFIS